MRRPLIFGLFALFLLLVIMQACSRHKKFYKSNCDDSQKLKHVSFKDLVANLTAYDNQYVEVSGKFEQGKDRSALFSDEGEDVDANGLWVEFSPDCPLYLSGTHIGFFDYDYNGGKLTPVNNKTITIRGIINAKYKGHLGTYKGSIGRISYVKI